MINSAAQTGRPVYSLYMISASCLLYVERPSGPVVDTKDRQPAQGGESRMLRSLQNIPRECMPWKAVDRPQPEHQETGPAAASKWPTLLVRKGAAESPTAGWAGVFWFLSGVSLAAS